ncbi:EscU/YscU/HrcU family type III secretion system export apparatus switch protein [Hydrogenimonas cancrithermarum]|uniref:Type III secretion protein n=1 Tax=Hydrogenimonas cancrithermarum TaxID=2993563 RepID=A0ABM8FKE9_9BACT|nr:EscU/YscU/HrcU family type III secretion system export apparatus switch protein [Hydrogenimonas cancrithermarum]BDY12793.1 type III secretion protein [Hydrogenimonas cancrithermarum]
MLTPKAAALKYNADIQNAPKVVAAGRGKIAQKILEKAKAFDVPLFQNEALAEALLQQEVGTEIDPQLFQAVAEVFIWLLESEENAELSK